MSESNSEHTHLHNHINLFKITRVSTLLYYRGDTKINSINKLNVNNIASNCNIEWAKQPHSQQNN